MSSRENENNPGSSPPGRSNDTQQQNDPQQRQQRQQQPQQERSWSEILRGVLFQIMIFYFISNMFKAKPPVDIPGSQLNLTNNGSISNANISSPATILPFWPGSTVMDLYVYISEAEDFLGSLSEPDALKYHAEGIKLGDWDDKREARVVLETTDKVQNNGTLYAHIFLTQEKAPHDPRDPAFDENMVVYTKHMLTKYLPKRREIKTKKLLGGDDTEGGNEKEIVAGEEESSSAGLTSKLFKKSPVVSHWHPNLTINIVSDRIPIAYNQMPPPILKFVPLEKRGLRDQSGKNGYYLPIVFPNEFWNLREHTYLINDTVKTLPLTIHFSPISFWKFQLYSVMEDKMTQQAEMLGGASGAEMDEFKRLLLETNPLLLGVTVVVSLLHSLFEFLAFKNDIAFWKNKKDTTGVSVRTLLVNIFFQLVIFLYLFDNNQDTSWMVLIGQGVGLLIEIWKVKKAMRLQVTRKENSFIPWRLKIIDNQQLTETEIKTREYDQMAYRYLSWIAFPLLIVYAIYSLIYNTHKSWYSYFVSVLVGFVYTWGFITLTPQLFINYKLKSVAHMPWRTLMYKSLNTFIDDLFAFVIKMPMLHRLACLRDDIVFFVYLYQRWIYKVDHTRANEFGQVGEEEDTQSAEKLDQNETKKEK
ncbi:uncharacterized protein VTP21DRAFT_4988 [Calcarisporiella thermophila]|uniref:uncharacterized protein n=1 Tax=Calcarisporiella thermophila TaxID=911321 RepID=UPI003742C64E